MDCSVVVERPAGNVGYFPHVPVGIGEGAGRAAPVGAVRMTDRASAFSASESTSHLLRGRLAVTAQQLVHIRLLLHDFLSRFSLLEDLFNRWRVLDDIFGWRALDVRQRG